MRLDHLLSKDRKSKGCIIVDLSKGQIVVKSECTGMCIEQTQASLQVCENGH